MEIKDLRVGDEVGIFFYDDWRGSKAVIETVAHVSTTGTITVSSGTRYNHQGREVGVLGDATYLCSIDKAKEILEKTNMRSRHVQLPLAALHRQSQPGNKAEIKELKLTNISQQAANNAIKVLNQYGYYPDLDGKLDAITSEITQLIKAYLDTRED